MQVVTIPATVHSSVADWAANIVEKKILIHENGTFIAILTLESQSNVENIM